MRLSDEEFWSLTLKEFNLLVKRHKNKLSAELYNSALICSIIANVNRGKGKPFQPSDFMPKENKRKKMSINEMLGALKAITVNAGGAVNC